MTSITIRLYPFSQPSLSIILLTHYFACFNKIEWEFLGLTSYAPSTQDFFKINPYLYTPVCVISSPQKEKEDLILKQVTDILQFLAEHFHWQGDFGFPTGIEKETVINALHKHNIISANNMVIFRSWSQTLFSNGKVPFDCEEMIKGLERAQNEWNILDTVLELNNGSIMGQYSIADVLVFCELHQLVKADEKGLSFSIYDFTDHPNIKQWLKAMALIFVNEKLECWKEIKEIITLSKAMMPIAVLEATSSEQLDHLNVLEEQHNSSSLKEKPARLLSSFSDCQRNAICVSVEEELKLTFSQADLYNRSYRFALAKALSTHTWNKITRNGEVAEATELLIFFCTKFDLSIPFLDPLDLIVEYHAIDRTTLVAGALILDHTLQYSLCIINNQDEKSLPRGKQQPGETPSETAIRECLEETGLDIQ